MSEHRGVSAAEKYAELEKAGALRPRCSCHGEEKRWNKTGRSPDGGLWTCSESNRVSAARWRKDNPEKHAANMAKQVKMFGQRFTAPNMQFREYAVQLREERRRVLKEASNG